MSYATIPNPDFQSFAASPDFSYWVGFRAAMTCATAEPVKRMAVVG
jgi:hypothetical protein